jgi:hypothetical protein
MESSSESTDSLLFKEIVGKLKKIKIFLLKLFLISSQMGKE